MKRHPGGEEHTRRMLKLYELKPGANILDMGAGAGDTLRLLNSLGFNAVGVDIEPRSADVSKGDMLSLPYQAESFDAVISQCAFYISGDCDGALSEAYRVLKKGGVLLLSDVWFEDASALAEKAGFAVLHREDMTALWREYYIEAIWRGDVIPCCINGKCTYEMLICGKE